MTIGFNNMKKPTYKIEKFTQYRATSPDGKIQTTAKTRKQAIKLLEEKIEESK